MDQHMRYVKAMQDQASALAKGVHALQHQLQQLHFNDQDADKELQPIQDDVQKTSQDLSKLIADQRVKNAAAEKLEEQALQARMHAEAAGERIQQCQDSLQAAERLLAEKRRELTTKRQEAQFKAAELECHQKQLQHVSAEQRNAEEQIHVGLEGLGESGSADGVNSLSKGISAGVLNKMSSSMERAKLMGSKVMPSFNKDRKAQAVAGQQEAALGHGSDLAQTSLQQETVFAPHSL